MSEREVAQLLGRARELVAAGWTQGAYCRNTPASRELPPCVTSPASRYDVAAAIELAARELNASPADVELARAYVLVQLPHRYRVDVLFGIERWNDDPATTRAGVLALLAELAGDRAGVAA